MTEYFDRKDTRPLKAREAAIFRDFKAIISMTKAHATTIRKNTRNIDIARIKKIDDLAGVPVHRAPQRTQIVANEPLYGGFLATNPAHMRHLLLNTVEGQARDWWNAGRALHAAGFVKGDIVLNCASYHMTTGGHMIDSGALQIGCPVIPTGPENLDWQLSAIAQLRPAAFCGKPGVLRRIVEEATAKNLDISSLKKAFVFGAPLSTHFRRAMTARGIQVRQAYTAPEVGVIAFETSLPDGSLNEGMIVNEGIILEIVKPGTDALAAPGEVGELVITRLNVDFPLLRFSTGDLSRIIPGPSPCGRTNARIQGWMGRVEEMALLGNKTLCPSLVLEMGARHACVKRMRLVVSNHERKDEATLRVEGPQNDPQLPINLKATMKNVLGFEARIDIVAPGMLPRDGKLIVDERVRA